jgi:hypothetical protein
MFPSFRRIKAAAPGGATAGHKSRHRSAVVNSVDSWIHLQPGDLVLYLQLATLQLYDLETVD